jgi:tRNA (guanine-N7-)-methyltransferase
MGRLRSSRGGFDVPPLPLLVLPGRELPARGAWDSVFGQGRSRGRLFGEGRPPRSRLIVEIGFGKDPFLLDRATDHPEDDHVGIERDPARVESFCLAAAQRGLTNVRGVPLSAELALGLGFLDGSVDELHVYFPDPWPKDRHADHRLVRPWFAQEATRVLAPGGRVFLATDQEPYACQMREVLAARGFVPLPAPETGSETKFERLWRSKGRRIQSLAYARPEAG